MRYAFRFVLALLVISLASECIEAQDVDQIIRDASNQEAFWSLTVRDMDGTILEGINSDKAIIPASNQKLVTTAAVLDHFGPDFRFKTHIYGDGNLDGDQWNGNLIIRGSGDPSISGDLYEGDRYHVFKHFTDQLKEKGVRHLDGMLMADVSLFDEQWYPKGWDWYDFSFYYGVQISPLSYNNNAVDLEVFAEGEVGEKPRIEWFPTQTDYVTFENEQRITPPDTEYDEYYRRELGGNRIVLGSTLPQEYYEEESLSIEDPAMFFLDSFKDYLNENGITFEGPVVVYNRSFEYDTSQVLATHTSKPLSELLDWANKESDNFYTEMFLKTLDAHTSEEPGSFEGGITKVREFLGGIGIDTSLVVMNDGSGMAAGNFNTTKNLSRLLVEMMQHPSSEIYLNSLAVAGVDGSLSYRMKDSPLFNNFKGKTGFVTGVRTLTGTLQCQSGRNIVVSMATNNFISEKVSPIDRVHERILMYLYEKY